VIDDPDDSRVDWRLGGIKGKRCFLAPDKKDFLANTRAH
jgi:hypothetical protein